MAKFSVAVALMPAGITFKQLGRAHVKLWHHRLMGDIRQGSGIRVLGSASFGSLVSAQYMV